MMENGRGMRREWSFYKDRQLWVPTWWLSPAQGQSHGTWWNLAVLQESHLRSWSEMVQSRNEATFLFEVGTPVPVSKGKRSGYFVVSLGKLHRENLGLTCSTSWYLQSSQVTTYLSKECGLVKILGRILSWTVFFKVLIGFFSSFHVIAFLSSWPWLWSVSDVGQCCQAALAWDRIAEDAAAASAGPQCWAAQTLCTGEIQELQLSGSQDTQVTALNISCQLKAQTLLCTPLPHPHSKISASEEDGSSATVANEMLGSLLGLADSVEGIKQQADFSWWQMGPGFSIFSVFCL